LPEEVLQKGLGRIDRGTTPETDSVLDPADDGDFVPDFGLNHRQVKAINFIKKNGYITNDYYIQINEISDRHARRDLRQLVDMDLIVRIGKGRSTRYVLK